MLPARPFGSRRLRVQTGPRLGAGSRKPLSSGMAPASSAYLRLKRYRQKRSLERERMYLAKEWPAGYEGWNAHQWASRKRWYIYYDRRRQERELGYALLPCKPRHWVGLVERERKRAKLNQSTCNLVVVRHL